VPAAAAALVAVGVVACGSTDATPAAHEQRANTAAVERGELSAEVSLDGTLTYRARPDGSPYSAINQARGIYTKLPHEGAEIGCGDVLYRVDDDPVLLLCGPVPAYRDIARGDEGKDVRQLNRNLHALGYDADADDNRFTGRTERALEKLQAATRRDRTGALALDEAVFLPRPVRIARVTGELGASARRGSRVARATSGVLEVQVNLDASQQGEVKKGDRAQIALPGLKSVTGTVDRLGRVARVPDGRNAGAATIPASIRLDHAKQAGGLDRAPVQVRIATRGVQGVLSVPVVALVGKAGGGFAVEVARDGGRRDLVKVELGLFDTTDGRVQVEGDLRVGDRVVVPSP
jgi:peptidoglycan hydrolase-like protein with peptidoglycan-binding domain